MPYVIPETLEINASQYRLLEIAPGRRKWDVSPVPSQPGDPGKPVPIPLEWHGGFGFTHQHTDGRGKLNGLTHIDYGQNFDTRWKGLGLPSPLITYLDLSTLSATGKAFVFGGDKRSRLGGSTTAGLGGGSFVETPQAIEGFGDYIYIGAGVHTHVIDPAAATPDLKETRAHAASARARSSDVFDNALVVALGSSVDAEVATSPYTSGGSTTWTAASGVQRSVFRVGGAGRLFSAKNNLVYQVLAGQNPATSGNYLPSGGEAIVDETQDVRSLEEFARGVVAGTARTLRTFDPDAGFQGRNVVAPTRASWSDYDGRGLTTDGLRLFYANMRAVWMIVPGREPERIGPELFEANESPYIGGQPGIPDTSGDFIYWPYYFPTTGDSVIFALQRRREGDPGEGPYIWHPFLYLSGRECRIVYFWGGTSARKARLFFGAGTTALPEQIGWVDLGGGGGPDPFNTNAAPALSSTLFGSHSDFGKPGVTREVERIELPLVAGADATNYGVFAMKADSGAYVNLVKAQSGSNQERVNSTGFVSVFAPTGTAISGRELTYKITVTQDSATVFWKIHGTPVLYLSEIPSTVEQITTLIDVRGRSDIEDPQVEIDRLKALKGSGKKLMRHGPGNVDTYIKIVDVREVEVELLGADGRHADRVLAAEIIWRQIAVA